MRRTAVQRRITAGVIALVAAAAAIEAHQPGRPMSPAGTAQTQVLGTLIVSSWPAQSKFDPNDHDALWGACRYTADKDVARVRMKVDPLPFAVEQLTWGFLDMTNDGGRMALM